MESDDAVALQIVMCHKNFDESFGDWKLLQTIEMQGFNPCILVLSWLGGSSRFFIVLNELIQILFLIYKLLTIRPNILYVDNSNILGAAFIAHLNFLFNTRIILRLMGVYPFMKQVVDGKSLKSRLFNKAYKAPFSQIICTQDGSDVERWLHKVANPKTKVEIIFNGVDVLVEEGDVRRIRKQFAIKAEETTFLFVGRLEHHKGIGNFIAAALESLHKNKKLKFIIVGYGSLLQAMKDRVKKANMEKYFIFLSELNHDQVSRIFSLGDVYISLNYFGNFSNTNLEAMKNGKCMVMPLSLPEIGSDTVLERYLSISDFVGISAVDAVDELRNRILWLAANPDIITCKGEKVARASSKFLSNWQSRIAYEMTIIKKLVGSL